MSEAYIQPDGDFDGGQLAAELSEVAGYPISIVYVDGMIRGSSSDDYQVEELEAALISALEAHAPTPEEPVREVYEWLADLEARLSALEGD